MNTERLYIQEHEPLSFTRSEERLFMESRAEVAELELADKYLYLEKTRLGERLQVGSKCVQRQGWWLGAHSFSKPDAKPKRKYF